MIAVHLGCRGDEHRLLEPAAGVEDGLGTFEIDPERPHRFLDDRLDADGSGEVVDGVDLVDQFVDDGRVEHAVDHEVELRVRTQVRDVLGRPCRQVVENVDLLAVPEEQLAQVRADKARTASDQGLQGDILSLL